MQDLKDNKVNIGYVLIYMMGVKMNFGWNERKFN